MIDRAFSETELQERQEFFLKCIYPVLSEAGIQDENDLCAVPILLSYRDEHAVALWDILLEALRRFS